MDAAIEKALRNEFPDEDFVASEGEEEEQPEEDEIASDPEAASEEDDDDEDDDDLDDDIDDEFDNPHADSSSEDEEDKQEHKKGFLDGGKAETFARAFSRILEGKPKNEVQGIAPILADSKSIAKRKAEEAAELKVNKEAKRLRLAMKRQGHVVPARKGQDPAADLAEKALQRIATKGVVQLFNAVSKAQKRLKEAEEVTGNKSKAVKLGKASFLAELRNATKQSGEGALVPSAPGQQQKKQSGKQNAAQKSSDGDSDEDGAQWDVLQEGFTGLQGTGKMKDWDREQSDDDLGEQPGGIQNDSDGDSDW